MERITREIRPSNYVAIRDRVQELVKNSEGEILYEERAAMHDPYGKTDFVVAGLAGRDTLVFNGYLNGRAAKINITLSGSNEKTLEQRIAGIIEVYESLPVI